VGVLESTSDLTSLIRPTAPDEPEMEYKANAEKRSVIQVLPQAPG